MNESPVACTLNEQDLVSRQEELKALRQLICEKRQLLNGFALRFNGSTENLMTIALAIAQELACC